MDDSLDILVEENESGVGFSLKNNTDRFAFLSYCHFTSNSKKLSAAFPSIEFTDLYANLWYFYPNSRNPEHYGERKGVGTKFIEAIMDYLREDNIFHIICSTPSNSLQSFLTKKDFYHMGDNDFYFHVPNYHIFNE